MNVVVLVGQLSNWGSARAPGQHDWQRRGRCGSTRLVATSRLVLPGVGA